MAIRISGYLIQHGTSLPFRIRDKVLDGLVVAVGHDLLHAFHVFATCLHQALQVDLSLARNGAGPTQKVLPETLREALKPMSHLFERGWDIGNLLGFTSL